MAGSALMGNRQTLKARHASFLKTVGFRHGLTLTPDRMNAAARDAVANQVIAALNQRADAVLQNNMWPAIRSAIHANPVDFAQCLGIQMLPNRPAKPPKTMAQIFTSRGAGDSRRENAAKPNRVRPEKLAVATATALYEETQRPLRSVGFEAEQSFDGDAVRVREDATESSLFDLETGEIKAPPTPAKHSHKLAARQWVLDALEVTRRPPEQRYSYANPMRGQFEPSSIASQQINNR